MQIRQIRLLCLIVEFWEGASHKALTNRLTEEGEKYLLVDLNFLIEEGLISFEKVEASNIPGKCYLATKKGGDFVLGLKTAIQVLEFERNEKW